MACLTAAAQACALTLGTPQNPVVLGAPLDVRITIVPDPGQTLDSSCIQAQVMQGEVSTPVRTTLIAPQTLRIRSQQAINEPLVSLTVSAGCSGQISRSYTLFADPPAAAAKHATRRRVVAKPSPRKNRQAPSPRPQNGQNGQSGPSPQRQSRHGNGTPGTQNHPGPGPQGSTCTHAPGRPGGSGPAGPEHHRIGQRPPGAAHGHAVFVS